jgi:hypothetical protein
MMAFALLDEERRLVEGMLKFANLAEIKSAARVEWMFRRYKYPREETEQHLLRLRKFQQQTLRDWLVRITKGEAAQKTVAVEVSMRLHQVKAALVLGEDEDGNQHLVFDWGDLNGDNAADTVINGCLAAVALILDHKRGLTSKLGQCRWSKCGKFNLDFEPKGRPRTHCPSHKDYYDREVAAQRGRARRRSTELRRNRVRPRAMPTVSGNS